MLPTPLTTVWSSSTRLIAESLRRERVAEGAVAERGVERIARDVRDLARARTRRAFPSRRARHPESARARSSASEPKVR